MILSTYVVEEKCDNTIGLLEYKLLVHLQDLKNAN